MVVSVKNASFDVKCNYKGGGNLLKFAPVFSSDIQSVYIAWNNIIVAYNTKTGKKTHEFRGLEKDIIGFGNCDVSGIEHVVACTKRGKVLFWKGDTALRLCKKKIPQIITNFKLVPTQQNENLPKAVFTTEKENKVHFGLFDFNSDKQREICKTTKNPHISFDVGSNGSILGIVSNRTLIIINLVNFEISKKRISKGRHFTSISVQKNSETNEECSIITGDNTGRILLWQNLFGDNITQSIYHWHTLPVNTVCFSSSGSLFYSGGGENVLVKWSKEDVNQRKYLPRLPSEIKHISPSKNNVLIAISTEDNGIQIVDARLTLVCTVQHLVLAKSFPCGVKYDARSKALILNGLMGHLQFYLPRNMHLLYNLDITNQNKLTNERNKQMLNTEVIKAAISKSGLCLATVEERNDFDLNYELRLKFWHFNLTKQTFELKCSVEYPHEKTITDIQFQPSGAENNLYCVTTSEENKFKLWQNRSMGSGFNWQCAGLGYYKDFTPNSACFSSDGSILAISFNSVLTLWIPDSLELKSALVQPLNNEKLQQIAFGSANCCHLICTTSQSKLTVWNILTLCINWTVDINCNFLISDPYTNHFALFSQQKLYIFTLNSSSPVYESKEDLFKGKGSPLSAVFVPSLYSSDTTLKWHERSQLYFIDSKQELFSIDTNDNLSSASPTDEVLQEEFTENLYKSTISKLKSTNISQDAPYKHLYVKSDKVLEEILYTPNTTKRPMHLNCGSVLYSMIYQKS